jgi:hypothetical protein
VRGPADSGATRATEVTDAADCTGAAARAGRARAPLPGGVLAQPRPQPGQRVLEGIDPGRGTVPVAAEALDVRTTPGGSESTDRVVDR